MSYILDVKADDIEIGQQIPLRDRRDPQNKTYYGVIREKQKFYECNCGRKVGEKYVEQKQICRNCRTEFCEKVAVKFT